MESRLRRSELAEKRRRLASSRTRSSWRLTACVPAGMDELKVAMSV
jgi:hypothetical protein